MPSSHCTMVFTGRVPQGVYPNVHGTSPPHVILMTETSERARTREVLREGWNTQYACGSSDECLFSPHTKNPVINQNTGKPQRPAGTPFRLVNNSGDYLARNNYSCGGSNQVNSRTNLHGLKRLIGRVNSKCDGTGIAASTCNSKYVYDSSDYITFKKQQAKNRNYNDYTFGGDENHAAQSPLRLVRH